MQVEYVESNGLLSSNDHGGCQRHNTATALLQMYEQWTEELEKHLMVGVTMVDLSAAFDMVDHGILLKKIEIYGMDRHSLSLS